MPVKVSPFTGALDLVGVDNFLELTDSPASYAGKSGFAVAVAPGEAALEFAPFAPISTAATTVYVDPAAAGAADGTSWTDAHTTIQAAWESLPAVVAHPYTIRARYNATPYREQIECTAKFVIASVRVEGEYYWQGDCEAHGLGAGEIVDTGAFADVAIGDHVMCANFNAGVPSLQYVGTVDNISNIPNRIGTTIGGNVNTTDFVYVIVRTEVSGSDDGTDGGTARNNCFYVTSVDNVSIYGFYFTFADSYAITFSNARNGNIYYCLADECDGAFSVADLSSVTGRYLLGKDCSRYGMIAYTISKADFRYMVIDTLSGAYSAVLAGRAASLVLVGVYIKDGNEGVECVEVSYCRPTNIFIAGAVGTGLQCTGNSAIDKGTITNNASTAESTASGGVIY